MKGNYKLLQNKMSKRILTTNEIQAVGAFIKDKESIQLLKEIRDNVITEEDTKGKRKNNEIFNFVGFSSGEDLLGEDNESEEYQQKKAKIGKLVDAGLVVEGFHIPLERKSEKKFGDVRVADVDDKIYKYQLTDEGYALLSVVEEDDNSGSGSQQPAKQTAATKTNGNNNNNSQQKSKEIAEFKAQQQKELKS